MKEITELKYVNIVVATYGKTGNVKIITNLEIYDAILILDLEDLWNVFYFLFLLSVLILMLDLCIKCK